MASAERSAGADDSGCDGGNDDGSGSESRALLTGNGTRKGGELRPAGARHKPTILRGMEPTVQFRSGFGFRHKECTKYSNRASCRESSLPCGLMLLLLAQET
jgi:hypothetical protein